MTYNFTNTFNAACTAVTISLPIQWAALHPADAPETAPAIGQLFSRFHR